MRVSKLSKEGSYIFSAGKGTHELYICDGSHARAQPPHKELAHAAVLSQVARLALVEVDTKDVGVELVSGNAEPDGEGVRVDGAVEPGDRPEGKGAEDVNLGANVGSASCRLGHSPTSLLLPRTCHGPVTLISVSGTGTVPLAPVLSQERLLTKLRTTRTAIPREMGMGYQVVGVLERRLRSRAGRVQVKRSVELPSGKAGETEPKRDARC